jgi:hypothetical protein
MKKKFATMAIAGLAVTAFAACSDDDETPDGSTDLPAGSDVPAGSDLPTGSDAPAVTTGDMGTVAPVTTAGG